MSDRENEIIALVTYIHNKLGFHAPPFSFLDFCRAFPEFDLVPAELPRGFNGEILVKGPAKIVRYRQGSKPSTNRFAIGHEIGHGFLHEEEDFKCKVSAAFSLFNPPPGDPREWEADFFAAELLMPMPVVNRLTPDLERMSSQELSREVARLAEIFGVNKQVARARLNDLEKMRQWECDFL